MCGSAQLQQEHAVQYCDPSDGYTQSIFTAGNIASWVLMKDDLKKRNKKNPLLKRV
jgi:hypothetical protein